VEAHTLTALPIKNIQLKNKLVLIKLWVFANLLMDHGLLTHAVFVNNVQELVKHVLDTLKEKLFVLNNCLVELGLISVKIKHLHLPLPPLLQLIILMDVYLINSGMLPLKLV